MIVFETLVEVMDEDEQSLQSNEEESHQRVTSKTCHISLQITRTCNQS